MAGRDSPPNPPDASPRNRRSSLTTATLSSIFRSSSVSSPTGTPAVPGPITTAALNDQNRRRRLSISTATALGLSGTSPVSAGANSAGAGAGGAGIPAAAFALRRASLSTTSSTSDPIADESAIDDDDASPARTAPSTPYARRMSFGAQAIRSNIRVPGANPGASAATTANDQGYNWSEQLRSRAESTVASGARNSFSFGSAGGMGSSPPRTSGFPPGFAGGGGGGLGIGGGIGYHHGRAKSVSESSMPAAAPVPTQQQQQPSAPQPRQPSRPKPDAFQERILKGDFYMD